jgi:hypothetical protein
MPDGFRAGRFDDAGAAVTDADGPFQAEVDAIDRATVGAAHRQEHAMLRRDGREGWLIRDPAGAPAGYGYVAGSGRIGPLAALDPALVGPIIGTLSRTLATHDERVIWLPTHCGPAMQALLEAGLRLDGFPALLCWSTPDTPFDRYVPNSLAIL